VRTESAAGFFACVRTIRAHGTSVANAAIAPVRHRRQWRQHRGFAVRSRLSEAASVRSLCRRWLLSRRRQPTRAKTGWKRRLALVIRLWSIVFVHRSSSALRPRLGGAIAARVRGVADTATQYRTKVSIVRLCDGLHRSRSSMRVFGDQTRSPALLFLACASDSYWEPEAARRTMAWRRQLIT
jgi:hypothetical protein